ncbi:MAG TPA: polar amino acid ABC transporter permease [Treponema sp.]|nr:polar amino acid ABC transporter permease [Treponema sp.]
MIKMLHAMLQGTATSLEVFFLTLLFAVPLALPVTAGRMTKNRILSTVTKIFLLIIRGTPLMLQLLVVYFGPSLLCIWINKEFGTNISETWPRFLAANVALIINYAAYFAEIYRGGIESIPQGQYEAAKVLGYTKNQTFFYIILPQVVKRIIPAMGNEVITLVKDTALVQVIGVSELLRVAQETQSRLFSFMPLFVAGVFYFIMNWIVEAVFVQIEKKLAYYK